MPHRRRMIAYNSEGCLFFVGLRKAIGVKGLIQNHEGFNGDSINFYTRMCSCSVLSR